MSPQRAANFMSFYDRIRNCARNNKMLGEREGARGKEGRREKQKEMQRGGRSAQDSRQTVDAAAVAFSVLPLSAKGFSFLCASCA